MRKTSGWKKISGLGIVETGRHLGRTSKELAVVREGFNLKAEARRGPGPALDGPPARVLHGAMGMRILRRVLFGGVALVLCGALFVAGAWVGAKAMEKPAPLADDEAVVAGKPVARGFVEAALSSRFAGRHREALSRLEEARRWSASLPGLEYQFALTHLDLREYDQAEACARQSVRRGEEKGNAYALLAMIALARSTAAGSPEQAREAVLANVELARETAPLNAAPHYVLAEFYRATGRPDLALEPYRMALERVSKSDSILVSTVKAGLSGVRLNHNPSAPPLEPKLVDGEAPPEQFFIGAADALMRGDKERAASYLAHVRRRVPAPLFKALLQDSFFQDFLEPGTISTEANPPPE